MPDTIITYHVQGSAPDPYIVVFNLEKFTISCTCQAGENGIPCKHRLAILSGEDPGIIQGETALLLSIGEKTKTTNFSELMEFYEDAKNKKRGAVKRADYAFKKYRDERSRFALHEIMTDRAIVKAREALEHSIDQEIEDEVKIGEALDALAEVLVRPSRAG